ncbi:MAG TPA: hypothetical protein PKV13_12785 [Propionicimonas sp.]|nr:hypothetical protein [Propionicimonas sp.]HRA07474.1 hypothetical protein [Propionicimonas sp.]
MNLTHAPKLPPSQAGRAPRVNLLPPSERGRRERRSLVRKWVLAMFAILAALALAIGAAVWVRMAADLRLLGEQERTQQLNIELAKYADVTRGVAARTDLGDYREQALANDLGWTALYEDVLGAMPAGVSIAAFDLSPGAAPMSGVDPATAAGLTGTFTCVTGDPGDQRDTVVALRKIPGALAVDAGSLTRPEGESAAYQFVVKFVADQTRYSGRFASETGVK